MQQEFYSNGKLLLSGEYAILDGAMGLAVPTKFGQSLKVAPTVTSFLEWRSFDANGQLWFEAKFDLPVLNIRSCSDKKTANQLLNIFRAALSLNGKFLENSKGWIIETHLTFPKNWGLGTSSTLINNMALWAEVDAFGLLGKTFGGSGYDIACAQHDSPLLYGIKDSRPSVQAIEFDPPFKENLFFVYLNEKQNSREAIANYRSLHFDRAELVQRLSDITENMATCSTSKQFGTLMVAHEALLSKVLKVPSVQSKLFPDYPGHIKSLGAWGGDFVLATGKQEDYDYFKQKGYTTILSYQEMVL